MPAKAAELYPRRSFPLLRTDPVSGPRAPLRLKNRLLGAEFVRAGPRGSGTLRGGRGTPGGAGRLPRASEAAERLLIEEKRPGPGGAVTIRVEPVRAQDCVRGQHPGLRAARPGHPPPQALATRRRRRHAPPLLAGASEVGRAARLSFHWSVMQDQPNSRSLQNANSVQAPVPRKALRELGPGSGIWVLLTHTSAAISRAGGRCHPAAHRSRCRNIATEKNLKGNVELSLQNAERNLSSLSGLGVSPRPLESHFLVRGLYMYVSEKQE